MGPWFGMTSTLDQDTLRLMEQHSALLQVVTPDESQRIRLNRLQDRLDTRLAAFGATRLPVDAGVEFDAAPQGGKPDITSEEARDFIHWRLMGILAGPVQDGGDDHA